MHQHFSRRNFTVLLALFLPLAGCSGGNSGSGGGTQNPVGPIVASIAPSSTPVGSAALTLAISGTSFESDSVVQVGGSTVPSTYVSSTQLTATVPASAMTTAGQLSVVVLNGTQSSGSGVSLAVDNPTPTLTSISPSTLYAGATVAATVTATGTNFVSTSEVEFNGSPRPTTFVSSTQLTFQVTAADQAAISTATITVVNSSPGGGSSSGVTLSFAAAPTPVITSISPGGVPLNTDTTLTIYGTGFLDRSTAQFDGTSIASTYVDNSQMTISVASSQITLPGNHSITVSTSGPGGGTSNPATLTAYIAIENNAMALNPVNGLLYVSVPGAAGPPYGDSIVSVDPATGAMGTPINVGSEPDKLAISSDGTTLWVGLDGASAIREVNLTTGTAGNQFSLGDNSGLYDYPPFVHAIAVLPGTDSSIVASVSTNNGLYEDLLTIYDNGVPRANTIAMAAISSLPAIFVNPANAEVYATSFESGYQVLSYDASGLKHLAGNTGMSNFSANYGTAVQVDNGNAYLDTGVVLAAETGTLEGTFYSSGTSTATGPMVSDSALGKNFILLQNVSTGVPALVTIQAFDESTYAQDVSDAIAVNGALSGVKYGAGNSTETELNGYNNIDTLVRWGSNGLAFRAANGIFSLRSNAVKDLSTTSADLGISLSAPISATAGSNFSVTAAIVNNGPSGATNAVMTATIPPGATPLSATSSAGSCFVGSTITCSLGNINNGAKINVVVTLQAMSTGTAQFSALVSAGETDPVNNNNSATATTSITGTSVEPAPVVGSLSPSVVQAGATDFTLTVNGSGFSEDSTIEWGTTALSTSFVSPTELSANVPSNLVASIGFAAIAVSTPSPGGGLSNALPFSIYSTINLAANHLLYDPYTRLLYASVSSASTGVPGNSLVTIDPNTGNLGTPVNVGSQPDKMALTDDGNFLYVNLDGANAVGRYNMATQHLDFSFAVGANSFFTPALRDIAVLPGSETTVAVDLGEDEGLALYDVNPTNQTATVRANSSGNFTTGSYTGSSLQFLNSSTLFSFDIDTSGQTFNSWAITSTGLSGGYNSEYTLNSFSAFKIRNGVAYANQGGVANPAVTPPTQLGVFLPAQSNISQNIFTYYGSNVQITEPDTSQGISFFAQINGGSAQSGGLTLSTFSQQNYSQLASMSVPFTISPTNSPYLIDMFRCGQDGLAILRSDGVIMLFQGGFVVPGLMSHSPAASLALSSALSHGSGNSIVTLTGSGFLPGVAVMWNGSYRTTTLVSSTQVKVALPASDLTSAGTSAVTAVNPDATPSNTLTVTIN